MTKVSNLGKFYTKDHKEAISECNNFYTDGVYLWGVNSEHKEYFRYPISLLESVCLKYSEEDEDNDYWYDVLFHAKTGQVLDSMILLWEEACEVQDWAIDLIAKYNAAGETDKEST